MGSMYEYFATDEESEKNGVVIDYGNFRVTLARAGGANKKFQRVLELKSRPYRRAIQTEMLDPDVATKILLEAYAEAVVRNWEVKVQGEWRSGIEGPEGELLPFNEGNVLSTYERLPDLFDEHREQASKAALYRASLREAAAGNSPGASSIP